MFVILIKENHTFFSKAKLIFLNKSFKKKINYNLHYF